MDVTLGYNNESMVCTDHVKIVIGEHLYIIRPSPSGGDGLEDGGVLVYTTDYLFVSDAPDGSLLLEHSVAPR